MLFASTAGVLGPNLAIVKCSTAAADLPNARVLDTIQESAGFGPGNRWEKRVWSSSITIKGEVHNFVRPYLIHRETKNVITLQHKAWMDSVVVNMWTDLVVGPWAAASGSRKILIWDNCGSHKTESAEGAISRHGIHGELLPPNMTDRLQVIDLVVNSPLKAQLRQRRASDLFSDFQVWKAKWAIDALEVEPQLPSLDPPKPSLSDGLRSLFDVWAEMQSSPRLQASVRRGFVTVGLALDTSLLPLSFRQFSGRGLDQHPGDEVAIAAQDVNTAARRDLQDDDFDPDTSAEPVIQIVTDLSGPSSASTN